MKREFYINNLWRRAANLPELQNTVESDLRVTEWSREFEKLMRARLVQGALRYGRIHAPDKPQYDRVASIKRRTELYRRSGNKEFLIDIANLCLLEFEEGCRYFESVDDGEHVKLK